MQVTLWFNWLQCRVFRSVVSRPIGVTGVTSRPSVLKCYYSLCIVITDITGWYIASVITGLSVVESAFEQLDADAGVSDDESDDEEGPYKTDPLLEAKVTFYSIQFSHVNSLYLCSWLETTVFHNVV